MVDGLQAMITQAGQTFSAIKDKAQWEWVDHSHLLRKLLREFRDGDPAKALRRAISITPSDGPATPTRAGHLPWMRAIYNLGDLLRLRPPGRGEAYAVLPAEPNLVEVLAQEYRKAARRAAEQGDFRRAAYIYGFLLRDDRKAAGVLQRGGLHHDAALLYLKKLNDLAAAAQAFEAAGEVDRAIELYRQTARHEAAGDLLPGSAKRMPRSLNMWPPRRYFLARYLPTTSRPGGCGYKKAASPIWPSNSFGPAGPDGPTQTRRSAPSSWRGFTQSGVRWSRS